MTEKAVAPGFGLVVIGNEILDGRRTDKHIPACRNLLMQRHLALTYVLIVPDEPVLLESQLRWAMARPEPFFCCGGIGSTPDDHTRQCAARAADQALELHPEGAQILTRRFGKEATPARMAMVHFPAGASLVPNPVNQVPGFHVGNGFFLPGFPEMAGPMMDWVLDHHFESGEERVSHAVVVKGCREADLVDLMKAFISDHPLISFSSLPKFRELELGVSGPVEAANAAFSDLQARLRAEGLDLCPA